MANLAISSYSEIRISGLAVGQLDWKNSQQRTPHEIGTMYPSESIEHYNLGASLAQKC